MNDDTRSVPTDAISAATASLVDPTRPAAWGVDAVEPTVRFSGSTPRKHDAIRAGIVIGSALVVAIGAAVAMGASPAPSASNGAGQPQTTQGNPNGNGKGFGPGGPRAVGPFGQFGPGGELGPGGGWAFGGAGRRGGPGFGQISVTAIAGSNVSLATADGWTRTITIDSSTAITKGGAAATFADLVVGDTVRFAETRNGDGTWKITALEIVLAQTAGTVTAVGSDTITIKLADGTSQTIRTTAATTYHRDRSDGKRSDVTVGSTILATVEKASDGSLTAAAVWVRLPQVFGTVTSTTANTITIGRRDGSKVTVHVASGTTIGVAGVAKATLSDVKSGMVVVVVGTQRADGSIDATEIRAGAIRIGHAGDRPGPGLGPKATPAPAATGSSQG